jgi:hypothetical protein
MFPGHGSGQQDRSMIEPRLDPIPELVPKLANFRDTAVSRKDRLQSSEVEGIAPQRARADIETHSLASLDNNTVLLCMLYEVFL